MTKEDFLLDQSNEPKKKLNKKQARKLAKKKNAAAAAASAVANGLTGSNSKENDQLVQKHDTNQFGIDTGR